MVTLISRWKLIAGCSDTLLAKIRQATNAVESQEAGTLMYAVHLPGVDPLTPDMVPSQRQPVQPLSNVSELIFVEIYSDAEAFAEHLRGDAFQQFKNHNLKHFYTDPEDPTMPLTETLFLQRQAAFVRPQAGL